VPPGVLSEQVNQVLSKAQVPDPLSVRASMVESMHLQWGIRRPALTQQSQVSKLANKVISASVIVVVIHC